MCLNGSVKSFSNPRGPAGARSSCGDLPHDDMLVVALLRTSGLCLHTLTSLFHASTQPPPAYLDEIAKLSTPAVRPFVQWVGNSIFAGFSMFLEGCGLSIIEI